MSDEPGNAELRKLAILIRSELHLDPKTLSEEEFIEASRDVLWLMDFKREKLLNELEHRAVDLIKAMLV